MEIHHKKLPDFSTLLSGKTPRDDFGFQSEKIQIWYNNTNQEWNDGKLHAHKESDEIFIILKGSMTIQIQEVEFELNSGEFCCFPAGIYHAVKSVKTPVESLMIRSPSIEDKIYMNK